MRVRHVPALTLILLAVAWLVPCTGWGDEAFPAKLAAPVEFDPPSFVPGQIVAIYARLDAAAAKWHVETLSSGLHAGQESSPRILSASLTERSGAPLLVVRYVAWNPGQGYIPSMTIGGLVTPSLKYSCSSALAEGGTEPPLSIGQLDPPGLFPRLYVIGGLMLVSAIGFVIGAARFIPWLRLLKVRRSFARVRREYDELLGRLEREKDGPAAWAELCNGLRLFLSHRTGLDWLALTSVEAAELPVDCLPGGVQPAAASILSMGDEARFAGRLDIDMGLALETARSIGERIDAALEPATAGKEIA